MEKQRQKEYYALINSEIVIFSSNPLSYNQSTSSTLFALTFKNISANQSV